MKKRSIIGDIQFTSIAVEFLILLICFIFLTQFIRKSKEQNFHSYTKTHTAILNQYTASKTRQTYEIRLINQYHKGKLSLEALKVLFKENNINPFNRVNSFSVDSGEFYPPLPEFALPLLEDLPDNIPLQTVFHGSNVSILSKVTIKNIQVISFYHISNDDVLKKNIRNTDVKGFLFQVGDNSVYWHENNDVFSENDIPLSQYSMGGTPQQVKLLNKADIDGFYYLISDTVFVKSTYSFIFFLLILLAVKFLISLLSTTFYLNIFDTHLKALVKNTRDMISRKYNEEFKEVNFRFEELHTLHSAFEEVIAGRNEIECELIAARDKMESKVEIRTRDLSMAVDQAEKAGRDKMNFLASVSHEIRTPMNCIIGFCELIINENKPQLYRHYADKIINESETLLQLINDVLDQSKIESGKMEIEENCINLKSFVKNIISMGNPYDKEGRVSIHYTLSDILPQLICTDELKLYRIVSNLYFNSLKYTPKGSVSINFTQKSVLDNNRFILKIDVSDTGIGIQKDRLSSVFESYSQVSSKLTRQYRGTGLGLTITKQIVEVMGGLISVNSELGAGSCFTVEIPVQSVTGQITQEIYDTDEVLRSHSGSILLVEDYMTNRMIALRHLKSAGYTVTEAENGLDAVNLCKVNCYDLILMDVQMPVMDGVTATRIIKEQEGLNQNTPVLAMTANTLDVIKDKCLNAGMSGFILKPMKRALLLENVYKYIAEATVTEPV